MTSFPGRSKALVIFFFFFFKIISSMFWSRIFKDVIEFQTRRWTTRLNSHFLIRVLSTLQALTTFSRMKLFLYFLEKKILILKTLVMNLKMLVSRFKKSLMILFLHWKTWTKYWEWKSRPYILQTINNLCHLSNVKYKCLIFQNDRNVLVTCITESKMRERLLPAWFKDDLILA